MKKYFYLFSTLLILLFISCKENPKSDIPTQMQQVMAIHDEVMPKMGTIGKLISQLEAKINETDSTKILVSASQELKDANTAMMDWMKGFGDQFDTDEIMKGKVLTKEKQISLDEEEIKVKALRKQMNRSIKNAEEILKSN